MEAGAALSAIEIADVAAATPAEALLAEDMPFAAHFRRDHYPAPDVRPETWSVEVVGAVRRPLLLCRPGLEALGAQTERVTLECAGHRRSEHVPPAAGLAWATGAVGEARWTGARLADVLARVGLQPGARFVVLEGADRGAFEGRDGSFPFARALPLGKALAPESILAWAVNDAPIPVDRGGPVRAVIPGWYATDSVKWLTRITVLEGEFDGPWETDDYRIIEHGEPGPGRRMTELPIHALCLRAQRDEAFVDLAGVAWGGRGGVERVDVRIDGGPWRAAELGADRGPWARRFWHARRRAGSVVEVRATDMAGAAQPADVPHNVCGYANNAVHRVTL